MPVRIAVLIPCYNEEKTVASVVASARKSLPQADIYVYDNNSTDNTAELARQAGAIVRHVFQRGKGSVVRRMFSDIDADVYLMTDGDMTYDLASAPKLIDVLIKGQNDMVVGVRKEQEENAYPMFHRFGNFFFTMLVRILFGIEQTDMLSGLRVFSKRFVKTFTARSNGFEIETELNIFTVMNRLPYAEVETKYFARPEGSFRKLSTVKDGFKVLFMIFRLFKEERPLLFFCLLALIITVFVGNYLTVMTYNSLFLSFLLIAMILFFGIFFHGQQKTQRELRRLLYMTYPFTDVRD